ncbi:MAG: S24 family peptidase [Bacteroidota bacterium]
MDQVSTLITRLREQKELNKSQAAERLEISSQLLGQYESGKRIPKTQFFLKWKEVFGDDLLELLEANVSINEPQTPDYTLTRRNNKIAITTHTAPLVPVKAQAGYVRAMDQSTFIDTMEQYALPPGVNPQGAVWRYWEVEGESMEPVFHNQDIILTSQVHQMDWENLRNFYLYVIVTDERVLFKRIYCKNPLEWVLISENEEEHPQQLLPVENIKEVWVFRRSILSNAKPSKEFKITV